MSSTQSANTQSADTDRHANATGARTASGPGARIVRLVSKLGLILHTLRYLRARQWVYLVIRRVLPDRYRMPAVNVVPVVEMPAMRVDGLVSVPHASLRERRLCFLNELAHFALDAPDWQSASRSKLWRYNLHYFEYLADPALSVAQCNALIDSWIVNNPPSAGDGWEPYPVSVRIVCWTKHFDHLLRIGQPIEASWRRSLYLQCDWLFHHMEFHIDANHLFKNIVALFIGAQLFRGNDDERVRHWHRKSVKWMQVALREQFNSDGGHYERSPMYHLLCLHYCLDAYNVVLKSQSEKPLRNQLADVIVKGLAFAEALQHSNGKLAFFNDSANGIAPDLSTLRKYAREIDGYLPLSPPPHYGSSWFAATGYFCWQDERQHFVASARSPSPAYQPGHNHADCLSYEYSLDGKPVIVNAGNTRYDISDERRYARSTAAHNTVEINSCDQSEMWSAFRMARRARVTAAAPQHTTQNVVFGASHDGYRRHGAGVVHQREYAVAPGGIEIRDTIVGRGRHSVKLFTHLHPDYSAVIASADNNICLVVDRRQRVVARIAFASSLNATRLRVERTPYFDQFGVNQRRDSIVIAGEVTLPCSLFGRIEPARTP
jgi:uncharacterized heparinase superfamily protein